MQLRQSKLVNRCCLFSTLSALALSTVMLCIGTAQAQDGGPNTAAIEIVSLNYRTPDKIRAAISPFVDSRGALSQIDNKLIISTSSDNLRELLALIAELDVPRQQLRISVDYHFVNAPNGSGQASQIDTTSTLDLTQSIHSIVMSEGEYAYFSSNRSTPSISSVLTDQGLLLNQAQTPQGSSFAVTAQRRGSRYFLELSTLESISTPDGQSETRVLNTGIELAPQRWYVLNDTQAIDTAQDNTQVVSTVESELVAIKVELIP